MILTYLLFHFWYKKKASLYIAQYPVLRTVQSTLHFTFLSDLFTQTLSRLLWEASCHMLQLMREGCSYTYPPLSIPSQNNLSKVLTPQYRVRTRVPVVESPKLLPLSHCSLRTKPITENTHISIQRPYLRTSEVHSPPKSSHTLSNNDICQVHVFSRSRVNACVIVGVRSSDAQTLTYACPVRIYRAYATETMRGP